MMLQTHFLPAAPRLRAQNAPLPLQLLQEAARFGSSGRWPRALLAVGLLPLCLLLTSCPTLRSVSDAYASERAEVPAQVVANFFIVDVSVDGSGPFRFLVDTGSTVSLVSPAVARQAVADPMADAVVTVESSRGDAVQLPAVEIQRLEVGSALFSDVAAAVFDFTDLSEQLGVRVDGLIGYPVFRDVLLTLDYPGRKFVISSPRELTTADGEILALAAGEQRPFAPIQVGDSQVLALIDTGSDAGVSLNVAMAPQRFASPLRAATFNSSISGDFPQVLGRLASDVQFGTHTAVQPIVGVTRGVSAVGGELLQHFVLTFDQRRQLLAVQRATSAPIQTAARRGTGVVFDRTTVQWRVAAVMPATPAETTSIAAGDICVRINGQPTGEWPLERYQALLQEADAITLTVATRTGERDVRIPVDALVR